MVIGCSEILALTERGARHFGVSGWLVIESDVRGHWSIIQHQGVVSNANFGYFSSHLTQTQLHVTLVRVLMSCCSAKNGKLDIDLVENRTQKPSCVA
jgi:hypothetical protein